MPSPLTRANSCIAAGADVGQEDVLLSPRGREKLEQPSWLDPEATAASIDEHVADIRTRLDKEEGRTEGLDSTGNAEAARRVGKAIAEAAKEKQVSTVVFNRNGFLYHGRVKALADAAREAGLEF